MPEAGFTLLEAIVALAIIGFTLIPVMTLTGEATRQLTAAADSNQRVFSQQAILAYLETLNPSLRPDGEEQLSTTLAIRWSSTPLVAPQVESRIGGRLAGFELAFYLVDVTVLRNEQEWFAFQIRKTGYQPRVFSLDGRPAP
ncbi:MAG: prepilin-type N-terminal cleavage/methylation domain-containing protein [Rhodospirillaceae bacterium]|nr:prepilin-type N-terminal cleavage/methylation domain-containing protein [Rhodospirillaceae bacterium]